MRKKASWLVVIVLVFSSLLFQGCAAKHSLKGDLTSLAPLRVRTCCVPYLGVRVYLITAVGGTAIKYSVRAWEKALEKEILSADVPKYHELIMEKFVEKASKEIPGWSPMIVEEQPASPEFVKNFLKSKSGPLLLFDLKDSCAPTLSTAHGFESNYRAVLYDSEAQLVWEKKFKYSSKKYGRHRSIEEYKADNFRLLKEEMEFAVNAIVSAFIEDLKKGIKTASE